MSITDNTTKSYPDLILTELAANAIIEASKLSDERKIPLSNEIKKRLHDVWVNIKTTLFDTPIPQIMYAIEKDIVAQLGPQQPENPIDLSPKIEILWEKLRKRISNDPLLLIGVDSCYNVLKQWEKQALKCLWGAMSQQVSLPNLTIQGIEAWFEDPANGETLNSIKELVFPREGIEVLPPQLFKCAQLQKLTITDSKITVLPEGFAKLSQLNYLNLSNNCITALPESLSSLSQLRELRLSGNQITRLPEWFCNFRQLRDLDVSKNYIKELPVSLSSLRLLGKLNLSSNQITRLPESFGSFRILRKLDLSSNQIIELPESFGNLRQLERLNLSHNKIAKPIPESFGNLRQLQNLYLTDTGITTFPKSFGNLSQLQVIYLNNDQLTTISELISDFSRLRIDGTKHS